MAGCGRQPVLHRKRFRRIGRAAAAFSDGLCRVLGQPVRRCRRRAISGFFRRYRKAQITVGQGSRQALQAYCPHPVLSPDSGNDSEAVLRMAVWNTLPRGADILIVRGHGGREFLADALRQHGFAVHAAEVYFRRYRKA
ncbi:uroporphyrinogen-III synthase [Kingella potus]|nr:uroporphyrinogen-III synthase [Kingella potus]UOO99854.1 uroporphyrinogen-III synthase [Kingella potus]